MNRVDRSFFLHPLSDVTAKVVGNKTQVWQFAVVLASEIGAECNICSHVFIEQDVFVGNRVTIKNGAKVFDGVDLLDDVFVGPGVVFANDRTPRSKRKRAETRRTIVWEGASIGANSVILPGVQIGPGALVGAGSIVTRDVGAGEVVMGNPARPAPKPQLDGRPKKEAARPRK